MDNVRLYSAKLQIIHDITQQSCNRNQKTLLLQAMKHSRHIGKIATTLLLTLLCASNCLALNFRAGDYYFDNSRLNYLNVKMIVGNVTRPFTRVFDMTPAPQHNWWKVSIDEDLTDLDYFIFVESSVAAGTYDVKLNVFLDSLRHSNEGKIRRTTLKSTTGITDYTCNWVFFPLNNAPMSDGYWRPEYSYNATPSGTLPIVHLNTENSATISSKEYYINGTLWIEDPVSPLGTSTEPLPIEVKGRGNWTWSHSNKKPYKVKFDTKQSPLGLDKSRHFILLAHSEDFSGYLRNTTGFELSKLYGMSYTPTETPVELILNGEYEGLYFLCEKIRVESGRVEIEEQADMETDAELITGGWLLELGNDGVAVIEQYQNNDPRNTKFRIMSQSPEELSQQQRTYIHDFLANVDSKIYVADKDDQGWEQYLDIHTVARFYVIHEVLENVESFSGSLFMHKERGAAEKLKFGPVWDFDNSYYQESTTSDHFIFDYNTSFSFLWIKELLKFPRFQQEVKTAWLELCTKQYLDKITQHAWQWREQVAGAEEQDRQRWPLYASSHTPDKPQEYLDVIAKKAAWLNARWNNPADVNMDGTVTSADATAVYNYLLNNDPHYRFSADVNGDGIVTSEDLTAIYNYLLN